MKYAKLSSEQLQELEKEFIDFLVVNGITADEWEKIKLNSQDKANAIIDQFSDVVWEGSLRKASYLEHNTGSAIYCFHCKNEDIDLIIVRSKNGQEIDLNELSSSTQSINIQTASKAYTKVREEEMFDLIKNGAQLSKGVLYTQLSNLI